MLTDIIIIAILSTNATNKSYSFSYPPCQVRLFSQNIIPFFGFVNGTLYGMIKRKCQEENLWQ